jgi:hypothetical protein
MPANQGPRLHPSTTPQEGAPEPDGQAVRQRPPAAAGSGAPRGRRRRKRPFPGMVRGKGAAAWCSVGLRTWRAWDAAGLVPRPVRIGGCVLWSLAELRAWRDAACPSREAWDRRKQSDRR